MLIDSVDLELLRIVALYKLLPPDELNRYAFASVYSPSAQLLLGGRLLEWCVPNRSDAYLRLSEAGVRFLSDHGWHTTRHKGRSLQEDRTRRIDETLRLALLCHRAGIDITSDSPQALKGQPVFVPSSLFRGRGNRNLVSSAQCAGFGHWGNVAHMLYHADRRHYGPYYNAEVKAFHTLLPLFGEGFDATRALVVAGDSYSELWELLQSPQKKNRAGQSNYAHLAQKTKLPLYLIARNDTGAAQLSLLRRPNYRQQIARLLVGGRWSPPPKELPGADGLDGTTPLAVAVDLNLARIRELCQRAWSYGYNDVAVAAFQQQVDGILVKALPLKGISLLYFQPEDLQNTFDEPLLYTPERVPAVSPAGRPLAI